MKTSVSLVGFMGAGKTAVGKVLAEKMGRKFIELDALIEGKAGKPIAEIFRQEGEIAFRELEIEAAKEASRKRNAVIACGGGIVLNQINIDRLKREGIIVYLKASPQAILTRTVSDTGERPLLNVNDRASEIKKLLEFREPFYRRAADITVDTTDLGIDEVVEQIIEKLKTYESFH
jgi:shikimate kinase